MPQRKPTGQPPEDPSQAPQGAAQPAPAAGASLGYSTIVLPSRGVLYGEKVPGGAVQMRKMRSTEMAKLQGQGGNALAKIEAVVNSCTKLPEGFSPKELLLTDSFFLMLAMRTMTFGSEYTYTYRCRFCGSVERATTDIVADLDEKPASDDLTEPIEIELPDAECTVACRFLRVADQDLVTKHAKRTKMSTADSSDPSYAYRMALSLIERDGQQFSDILQKQDFITRLSAADSVRLERGISDKEPGVDIRVFPDCSSCGATVEQALPFDAEFFRPSSL